MEDSRCHLRGREENIRSKGTEAEQERQRGRGGDAPGRAGRVSAKIKPELLMLMLRRKIKSVL